MGDEDISLEAFAEQQPDNNGNIWLLPVKFKGKCNIGCEGRKLRDTTNVVTALNWVEYHREGFEHIEAVLTKHPLPLIVDEHGMTNEPFEGEPHV